MSKKVKHFVLEKPFPKNTNIWKIDTWLMSCRVIKRNMEFAMFDELVRQCREKGVIEIIGYYFKSSKNEMVSDLYKQFGFTILDTNGKDTTWSLTISKYENLNNLFNNYSRH